MKIDEIQSLIKFVAKSGVSEVSLELKDFKITIKTPPKKRRGQNDEVETTIIQPQIPITGIPTIQPIQTNQPEAVQESAKDSNEKKEEAASDNVVTIKSPMIGTFYRAAAPDKPPFIAIGDNIEPGKVLCIIEAMKLFNEIESEINGKIIKVLVEDATPVEYDQPLFLVEPL